MIAGICQECLRVVYRAPGGGGGLVLVLRILASPENVSSVLTSINAEAPMRVHLLAGVAWVSYARSTLQNRK